MRRYTLLIGLVLLLLSVVSGNTMVALADDDYDSRRIELKLEISPALPAMVIEAWFARGDGGTSTVVNVNDNVAIKVRTSQDAYIYVLNVDPSGVVRTIFPNVYDTDNFVKRNAVRNIPQGNYTLTATEPGVEYLIILASATRLSGSIGWVGSAPTRGPGDDIISRDADDFLGNTKLSVLQPNYAYAAEVLRLVVLSPQSTNRGAIHITSSPSDALAFVDGAYVGNTPILLESVPAGQHEVTLVAEGYRTVVRNVNVRAGALSSVGAQMTAISGYSAADTLLFSESYIVTSEDDDVIRSFSFEGRSGVFRIKSTKDWLGRVTGIDIWLTRYPENETTQIVYLDADTVAENVVGQTFSVESGVFRAEVRVVSMDRYEKQTVFGRSYFRSMTFEVKVYGKSD